MNKKHDIQHTHNGLKEPALNQNGSFQKNFPNFFGAFRIRFVSEPLKVTVLYQNVVGITLKNPRIIYLSYLLKIHILFTIIASNVTKPVKMAQQFI